jgi:threonine dehydratase
MMDSVSLDGIRAAQNALRPYLALTPIQLCACDELAAVLGADTEVVLKLELFQRTGTFKPRGALTVMQSLSPEALARGVTAVSAGNHAIATAYAARALGTTAKVVMLASANAARIDRCRRFGAEVVIAPDGRTGFAWAEAIEAEEGRTFVHPFEGPLTALGTATLGLEFAEQAGDLDAVIIPIGGGGLFAGMATAIRLALPNCRLYGVEPQGADSMRRSLAAGKPVTLDAVKTIADSLGPPYSLPYSFECCRRLLDDLVLVSDDEIRRAMDLLFREMRLAVEPAAASATAALLGPLATRLRGKRVGVLVCGTNIDLDTFHLHVGAAQQTSPYL